MNPMQSIESPWGVSVLGTSDVTVAPDLARLNLSITQTRNQPAEAFEATRAAVNRTREILRGHRIPDSSVSTSRLDLRSSWSFKPERTFLGYDCTASFVIELRDLDILETVLVDVVDAGANEVGGVEFDVSTRKELRDRARAEAVTAAREKAEVYAAAANVHLGPIIHIKDLESDTVQFAVRRSSPGMAGPLPDFTPGQITITAGVVLGFALLSR